ncbi:hypothetical protein, partial [Bacillus sp. WP8]|uniref:hypothetical protein n=1 Tax=Bacillus sp. WP8 TaxID=756828 RepID=UPI001642B35A
KEDMMVAKGTVGDGDVGVVEKVFGMIMGESPEEGRDKEGMMDELDEGCNGEMDEKRLIKGIKEV